MCVVSFIGDHYQEKWKWVEPYIEQPPFNPSPWSPNWDFTEKVTRAEFEALRKEVLEMKELIRKAKIYDEKNNEPNCEIEDKIKVLRDVARLVGIDLDEILKPKP